MKDVLQGETETGTIVRKVADPDTIFLEEAKKKHLQEAYGRGIRKGDRIGWESYEEAVILPMKKKSVTQFLLGVLDKEGNYVAASSVDRYLLHGGYLCEAQGTVDRRVVYCGTDSRHWGHFLVNVVPRLWIALEMDEVIDEYVMVRELHSGEFSLFANEIEFFRLLGILDKVRVIDAPTRYRNVIVPEASYYPGFPVGSDFCRGIFYEEFLATYDHISQKALAEGDGLPDRKKWEEVKKVLFSRPKTEGEAGVEVVDSFFANNGYRIVYAERISLTELIYYLYHCDSVAYLSGTIQHNMLFALGGVRRSVWNGDCGYRIIK